MVSLVITDLDGTITGRDRAVHLKSVRCLRALQRRGIPVGIATGNTLYYTRAAATLLGLEGPLIAENGGVVEANGRREVLADEDRIDLVRRAYRVLREELNVRRTEPPGLRRTEVAIHRDVPVERVREVLREHGLEEVEVVDTGFAYHLKLRDVDKGRGLRRACELMGVDPEDVVALGDGDNDAPMLRAAGLGVAPANASRRAREAADVVLDAEDGEGVAEFLRSLLREV